MRTLVGRKKLRYRSIFATDATLDWKKTILLAIIAGGQVVLAGLALWFGFITNNFQPFSTVISGSGFSIVFASMILGVGNTA